MQPPVGDYIQKSDLPELLQVVMINLSSENYNLGHFALKDKKQNKLLAHLKLEGSVIKHD